ncbi:MAG: hypothetical protein JSS58_00890 [Proteobacteria bacterium]|nr:hypothetical protein [Pseudomonadota bacterium]
MLLKLDVGFIQPCIDWAIQRLQLDQENEDLDVVLLAAATTYEDAFPLVEQIIVRYVGADAIDQQLAAGKYIAKLFREYKTGAESIESLDTKFSTLYYNLGYPSWLVMLSRNCEYATDIDTFNEPFEQEFEYIAKLWDSSSTLSEFESKYDRKVSNQHDAKYY